MREIEVKLRVGDLANLEKKLAERGCVLSVPIRQEDVIYLEKGKSPEAFTKGDVAFRIRRFDDIVEFNMKQQCSGEMDNIEYETEIRDSEAIRGILATIGYVPFAEVKKIRRKGKLGNYEICLDEVAGLGNFVELEKLTEDGADPEAVREELFDVLESLGLLRQDEEKMGYDTQIYRLSH